MIVRLVEVCCNGQNDVKKIRRRNINRLRRESRVKLVIAILLIFALIMGAGVRVIYLNVNKGTEYKKKFCLSKVM